MLESSVDILKEMMFNYIIPLLEFAEIYVDSEGYLRPKNSPDPDLSYKYEDKPLIVISSNAQLALVKSQKEEFEIFNPILIPRQAVFLANMVMQSANKKSDISSGNLVYDEDLDEYIEAENNKEKRHEIRMFHMKDAEFRITNRISFSYTDESGNPIEEELAGYAHDNVILATIGACINLAKKFKGFLSPLLVNTDVAILKLMDSINKYRREQQKEKGSLKEEVSIRGSVEDEAYNVDASEFDNVILDYSAFEDDWGITSDTKLMLPWDKVKDFRPSNPEAKIWKGLVMPSFKTIIRDEEYTEEDKMIHTINKINEITSFDDMVFDN